MGNGRAGVAQPRRVHHTGVAMTRTAFALMLMLPIIAAAVESTVAEKTVLKELEKYDHFDSNATVLKFGCHSKLPDAGLAGMKDLPRLEELDFISDKVT